MPDRPSIPQAMRPDGRMGAVFGFVMARLNGGAYRWTIEQLGPFQPRSFLEIGFGTGHLLAQATRVFPLERVAGVDPSPLMVETARKRLAFAKSTVVDIRQ